LPDSTGVTRFKRTVDPDTDTDETGDSTDAVAGVAKLPIRTTKSEGLAVVLFRTSLNVSVIREPAALIVEETYPGTEDPVTVIAVAAIFAASIPAVS
jgi:hypothetical protein